MHCPLSSFPPPTRYVVDRHGLKIVIIQSGRVGVFDAQQSLVNVVVAFGLLRAVAFICDILAFWVCPMRHVYRQYATRSTVKSGDLRRGASGSWRSGKSIVPGVVTGWARWLLGARVDPELDEVLSRFRKEDGLV